ncbi:MAG: glycosyltransferase [Gemmataceae bacterium]
MSLSIGLVTRDAGKSIERALRSVLPLGAEVIVGDTGSKDGTVPTARALGVTVVDVPWDEDFSAAQNHVLDRATGDWVFWVNPDEELVGAAPEHVAALLARPDAFAYVVRVQELTSPDRPAGAVETWSPRLFRRRADVRFAGRLHPAFSPPLDEVARRAGGRLLQADLVLRRHAYLSELTPAKLRWAARLLKRELADRPGHLHYLVEYGRTLLLLNDPKGHDVMAQAADLVLAAKDAPVAPMATAAPLLEYLLTVSPEQSRSRATPEQAAELAGRWFPSSPPLLWVLATRAFQAGDYRAAAGLLERLVHLGRSNTYDRSAPFDPSLMAEPALLNLANCYLRLGDLDRAEATFGHVMQSPGYQEQARRGYAAAQAARRAGRGSRRGTLTGWPRIPGRDRLLHWSHPCRPDSGATSSPTAGRTCSRRPTRRSPTARSRRPSTPTRPSSSASPSGCGRRS